MKKVKETSPKGLHNVFDNSPEMVIFREKELKRAIKYVGGELRKQTAPIDIMNKAIGSYGFTIGYEAFRCVMKAVGEKSKSEFLINLPCLVKYSPPKNTTELVGAIDYMLNKANTF